jgi:hypothetical protein
MKKNLLAGVLAVVVAVLAGLYGPSVAAQQSSKTWSIAVHIAYPDGFIYDHVFMSGVPTSGLPSILQACGRAHIGGSAVQYHCYPIPE